MMRLVPAPGLPDAGTAVSIALGVLKHAKVRRWGDLPQFPVDLVLTTGQPQLLTRFHAAVTLVAQAADGQPAVTIHVCPECKRWSLLAKGAVPAACPLLLDCPGKPLKVNAAQIVPLVKRVSGRIERSDGTVEFRLDDVLHNEDGPAVILPSGEVQHWVRGKLHNLDGPAISRADGSLEFWVRGKRHNPDGPAITRADGSCEFWIKGQPRIHTQGPSRIHADGSSEYVDSQGRLHRPAAPAIERPDGSGEWFHHGKPKIPPMKELTP